jgi:hypothetical protein
MHRNLRFPLRPRVNWLEDLYDQRDMGYPRGHFHYILMG